MYGVGHYVHTAIKQPLLQYDSHGTQLGIHTGLFLMLEYILIYLIILLPQTSPLPILFFPNSYEPFSPPLESTQAKSALRPFLLSGSKD